MLKYQMFLFDHFPAAFVVSLRIFRKRVIHFLTGFPAQLNSTFIVLFCLFSFSVYIN